MITISTKYDPDQMEPFSGLQKEEEEEEEDEEEEEEEEEE